MRKIKEILRLKWANSLSNRKIAHYCGVSRPMVTDYLRRAEQAGLSWLVPDECDDAKLERTLFPEPPKGTALELGVPNWAEVHQEMKKKSVTLFLLWQEYRAHAPQEYQYSWFCCHYRQWLGKRDWVMRQNHRAGEKLFVDYEGQTVPVLRSKGSEPFIKYFFWINSNAGKY